jgi:hypothetical protein
VSDDGLRELERAHAASPQDGATRLKLARAYARAGNTSAALSVDPCGELAREVLASFRCAASVTVPTSDRSFVVHGIPAVYEPAFDASTGLLAWTDLERENLVVADLTRAGEVVFRLEGNSFRAVRPARGRFLLEDAGAGKLFRITLRPAGPVVEWTFHDRKLFLAWADPKGARFATTPIDNLDPRTIRPGHTRMANVRGLAIQAWPSLATLAELGPANSYHVDWEADLILRLSHPASEAPRGFLHGLDGKEIGELPQGVVHALGRGLFVVVQDRAVWLCGPRLGTPLQSTTISLVPPMSDEERRMFKFIKAGLSEDGRRIRAQTRGGLESRELDLERRAVGPPVEGERGVNTTMSLGWHAYADAVFCRGSGSSTSEVLRPLVGGPVLALPEGAKPRAWMEDGLGLLVELDSKDRSERRFELWRTG